MKRLTPLFVLLFAFTLASGCRWFSADAQAGSVSAGDTTTDAGDPDVPNEPDGMPPEGNSVQQ